jgi:cation transport protein ChaC
MWVFAYGSLMSDGWEKEWGCLRRRAVLRGYRRVFNKASVRNWGTRRFPCPTLNLVASASFRLPSLPIRLDDGATVRAVVSIYHGQNEIRVSDNLQIAKMAIDASGSDGSCTSYIEGVADQLRVLNIDDPVVKEISSALAKLKADLS